MKYIPIALLVLLVIGLIAFAVNRNSSIQVEENSIYENDEFGYSVQYPNEFTYDVTPGSLLFGTKSGGRLDGEVELRIFEIDGISTTSLAATVSKEAASLCAEATTDEFNCTGAQDLEPFTTSAGVQGYELDLVDASATSSGRSAEKGPFFFIPLQTGKHMVALFPPLELSRANADASVVRSLARSVRTLVTAVTPSIVEAYVSSIISDLSNEAGKPEALGGTFYVTDIAANDGKGVVSYEDGHNAYTADFTYSIDVNGRINVNSFTVR